MHNRKQIKKRINHLILKGLILIIAILSVHQDIIAYAAEESESIYLYHQHMGSEEQMGGCYQQPVCHVHEGDEAAGGGCYQNPVYHIHEGNEATGGSCYEEKVYHTHSDSCYSVRHIHGDGCYRNIGSDVYGCYVVKFWDTIDGDYEGHDFMYYQMSCGRTVYGTNAFHYHEELHCNGTGGTNERVLSCQREGTVERYKLSCSKTGEVIDGYCLSCTKTEADIEKYQISCGKEEGTAYGKVTVSKRLSDNGYDAALHVQLEDYTGGELQLSNSGFSWYGSDGSCLGNGESITVTQNGTYRVAVGLQNQDITGGQASITVSDIREYVPPTPAPTSEPVQEPIQEPIPETEPDPTPEPVTESKEMVEVPEPEKKEGLPAIAPTEVPVVIEEETIVLEKEAVTQKAAVREMIQPTPAKTPTPTIKPFIKKETETVKAEEKLSTYEVLPEIRSVQEEKPSLLASPVVKVITVTVGTFTIFTGLFLLYYLLRRSVAVYNDDGSGRMKYIGRCLIQENDKGYLLTITEKMIQNAMTNRYMIKPGIFGWGKQNEELVVEKQSKLIPVLIEKEMIVVI